MYPPVPGKAAPRRPVRFRKGAKQVLQHNLPGQIAATHPRALGPAPKYPPKQLTVQTAERIST